MPLGVSIAVACMFGGQATDRATVASVMPNFATSAAASQIKMSANWVANTTTALSAAHNPIQNNDAVNAWNDSGPAGDSNVNATQATGAAQPTYNSSNASYSNKPTITFGSAGMFLRTGTFATAPSSPVTIFVVGHATFPPVNPSAFDGLAADSTRKLFWNAGSGKMTLEGSLDVIDPAVHGSISPAVFCCLINGASSSLYYSAKTAVVSGDIGTTTTETGFTIGNNKGIAAADYWGGPLAEIRVYPGALSNAIIGQILTEMGATYAITIGA